MINLSTFGHAGGAVCRSTTGHLITFGWRDRFHWIGAASVITTAACTGLLRAVVHLPHLQWIAKMSNFGGDPLW